MAESLVVSPLADLLRRYSFGYTAAHDFTVCDRIMVDDYVLLMGPAEVKGRNESYKPATARMYAQFPGLGFAVHDLMLGTERVAMRFSEHGRSNKTGTTASWRGISLYRTRGELLAQCRVEQDYQARGRQLSAGLPDPVPAPDLDPWTAEPLPPNAAVERAVRQWLHDPSFLGSAGIEVDDEAWIDTARVALDNASSTVLDLFSAGNRAAFHVRLDGTYRSGLAVSDNLVGHPADLYLTGIVTVAAGDISGHRVSDRYTAARRLTHGS